MSTLCSSRCLQAILSCCLISLSVAAASSAVSTPVLDDVTVNADAPNDNYSSNTYQGGLFVGGNNRFYLKFELPVFAPGTQITSATLTGSYQADLFDNIDGTFGIFLAASDAWSEGSLTWNNQPGYLPGAVALWDASIATFGPQSFDVTSAVNAEYQGDGAISFVFRELSEPSTVYTWEYWHSKEALPAPNQLPFVLDVTIQAVPEPGTGVLLALGIAGVAARRRAPRG